MHDNVDTTVTRTLVEDLIKEKRAERFWKNLRFAFWFLLIVFIVYSIFSWRSEGTTAYGPINQRYVSLIRLEGMIAPGRSFSAEEVIPLLEDAFKDKSSVGVMIDINSPGGTPVQSAIIHDAILHYKQKYKKRVVIVGEDFLASGAYYVSVAADSIYVNANTFTGSIGAVMKGFGFVDLMKKIGVERRVYVSGAEKDRLDPFLPQTPEDLAKVQGVANEIHTNFSQAVMNGRKGKLKADPAVLFSGDFWTGQTALQLGLVDGLGNLMDVMEKEFKTQHYKEFNGPPNFMKFFTGPLSTAMDHWFYSQ